MFSVHRFIVIWFLVMLLSSATFGQRDRDTYNPGNQSFEVSGQVNISGTNNVASNVPVRLERFTGGVVDEINTDSRGGFRFTNLQRGYYRVVINAPGFSPAQQEADVTLLSKAYLVFALTSIESNSPGSSRNFVGVIDARVPPDARDEFVRGREALSKGNARDASAHLQKALSIYPQFFEAELLLGTAFMDLRDWAKAEAALLKALEINSHKSGALIALG